MRADNNSRHQHEPYPEPNAKDVALSATKVVLAAVPVLGGSATELLELATGTIAERRDAWLKGQVGKLWDEVRCVRDDLSPENLAANPQFVTALIRTTQIAIGTHRFEKLEMLRNALRHIALGNAPGDDLQEIYLRLVEDLTPSHVLVLNYLWKDLNNLPHPLLAAARPPFGAQPPKPVPHDVVGAIRLEFPNLGQELIEQLLFDLGARRLLNIRENHPLPMSPPLTNHGIGFLTFVLE
jgi:hypothetical protein